jgi:hypothetical protein
MIGERVSALVIVPRIVPFDRWAAAEDAIAAAATAARNSCVSRDAIIASGMRGTRRRRVPSIAEWVWKYTFGAAALLTGA